jgi:hypothetical protein
VPAPHSSLAAQSVELHCSCSPSVPRWPVP